MGAATPGAGAAPPTPAGSPARGRRLAGLAVRFSGLNASVYLAGFVTGPLLAHALGPEGRGQLAAILVPIGLAPLLLSAGLPTYAARAAARGAPPGTLLGTVAAMSLALGAAGALGGVLLAPVLAEGRDTVEVMLVVGFAALPLALIAALLSNLALGLSRYREIAWSRVTPPVLSLAGIAVLAALGELTVLGAAVVTLAGGVASILPLLPLAASLRPVRCSREVAREAAGFGARVWVGGISATANARLDQLLMVTLVSERQLGLYAVAVSFAGLLTIFTSTTSGLVLPRVARGDYAVALRTLRVTLLITTGCAVALAAAAWVAVPLLFGTDFRDAVLMACVLLAAGIPLAGAAHLTPSLTAVGHAGVGSFAQTLALVVTAAALPLVLPAHGALGAAFVSLGAYAVSFGFLLWFSITRRGGTLRDHLLVTSRDAAWIREVARPVRSRAVQR